MWFATARLQRNHTTYNLAGQCWSGWVSPLPCICAFCGAEQTDQLPPLPRFVLNHGYRRQPQPFRCVPVPITFAITVARLPPARTGTGAVPDQLPPVGMPAMPSGKAIQHCTPSPQDSRTTAGMPDRASVMPQTNTASVEGAAIPPRLDDLDGLPLIPRIGLYRQYGRGTITKDMAIQPPAKPAQRAAGRGLAVQCTYNGQSQRAPADNPAGPAFNYTGHNLVTVSAGWRL